MASDSIVDEVRAIRDAYAKRFGYDLKAIMQDLKEQTRRSGWKTVTLPPKRIAIATNASESEYDDKD